MAPAKKTAKKTTRKAAKKTAAAKPTDERPDAPPDAPSPDDQTASAAEGQGGATTDAGNQPAQNLVKLPEPASVPQLDRRPGEPRPCKAPRCPNKPERRGLCGYHWAVRRDLADPA